MGIGLRIMSILCFCRVLTAEEVKLDFSYDKPVLFHSESLTTSQIKVGTTLLSTEAKEKVDLKIQKESLNPLTFTTTLVNFDADIKGGGKEIHFDQNTPETGLFSGLLKILINRPVSLTFRSGEEGIHITDPNIPQNQLLKDSKLKLDKMLFERLRVWLSLYDTPIKKGDKITFSLEPGELSLKSELTYEITDITSNEVKAHVTYRLDRQKLNADFPQKSADIVAFTRLEGDATWNLKNSFLYQIEMKGVYHSTLENEDMMIYNQIEITVHEHTTL